MIPSRMLIYLINREKKWRTAGNLKQKGFTLVELSIVMIIIGLLIGGILKGMELVENAKIIDTIKLIKTVEAAGISFEDKYAFMPGDLDGTTKIPNCDASTNCVGGDENGTVTSAPGVDDYVWTSFIGTAGSAMEATQFWKHLALGNFIVGIDPAGDPNAPAWGVTHPASAFGGGLEFFYDPSTTIGYAGHIIRFSNNGIYGAPTGTISPAQAANIDRKLDDGGPDSGIVFADYGASSNECKTGGQYRESRSDAVCMLFISLYK